MVRALLVALATALALVVGVVAGVLAVVAGAHPAAAVLTGGSAFGGALAVEIMVATALGAL